MVRIVGSVPCALALTCAAGLASAESVEDAVVTLADGAGAVYGPGPSDLPKGTQLSLLQGDPDKPGAFVVRVRLPANTTIAPHANSQTETLTILSGSIFHQRGGKVDRAKGEELKAGGFLYMPRDVPHALWTTGEPAEFQVSGVGPFGLTYVDPADDPSRSAN